MSKPTFILEAAFANDPMDETPTYTNISSSLAQLSVRRGRNTEEDQAQTGTLNLALRDFDRRFDPNNTAGLFYPNIKPMKRHRLQAVLDGTTYPVFLGWGDIENSWRRSESQPRLVEVNHQINDGFEILANSKLINYDYLAETTGVRVHRAFITFWMWPHDIDTGYETMQATSASNTSDTRLMKIREAELTEPGFFFIARDGTATFRDRRARYEGNSVAAFTDLTNQGAGILCAGLTTRQTPIWNEVVVTCEGGTAQEVDDADSQAAYLVRTAQFSTQHETDDAALQAAYAHLNTHKDTYERVESLILKPGTDSASWAQVLGRDINDRITIVRTPAGGGTPISEDYYIEGVNLDVPTDVAAATCEWRLSYARAFVLWRAGTVGASEAGVTTRAVY